jgi:hypothetical protein
MFESAFLHLDSNTIMMFPLCKNSVSKIFLTLVFVTCLFPSFALQVNRDPSSAEVARLRQQLQLIQAELLCCQAAGGGDSQVSCSLIAASVDTCLKLRVRLTRYH